MQKIEENKDLLKFNAEGYDPTYIWHEAKNKAVKAVDDFVAKHENQCIVVSPMFQFIRQEENLFQ